MIPLSDLRPVNTAAATDSTQAQPSIVMPQETATPATPEIIAPCDRFKITFAPIDLATVYQLADASANGAIVLMSGMVRDNTEGRAVTYLEYQAYEPMAIAVFGQIDRAVRRQWPDVERLVIHHRTGRLQVGEISVLVAVGCPHRGEAFEACRYAIDTLKHNAPIWKKEHWADGSSSWVSIGDCER